MMSLIRVIAAVGTAFLAMAGCRKAYATVHRISATSGPHLVTLDSIELRDVREPYLRRPIGLAVDDSGAFYVADVFGSFVAKFNRSGIRSAVYGGHGYGPGKIELLKGITLLDSTLVLVDADARDLVIFDPESGKQVLKKPLVGTASLYIPTAHRNLWMGYDNATEGHSVLRWNPATGDSALLVPRPEEYRRYPWLRMFFSIPVVAWSDSLLVGFGPLNAVLLADTAGQVHDTLRIPVRLRRGVPEALATDPKATQLDLMNGMSGLVSMHRLSTGDIALVHYDNRVILAQKAQITASLYVSLLKIARRLACVDAQVPLDAESLPYTAFRGDTLFVVAIHASGDRSRTFIHRYLIGNQGCTWVNLPRATQLLGD